MTAPATIVLARLTVGRRDGLAFDEAWPLAIDGALATLGRIEREEWASVLTTTREVWEAAFERRPATRRARALAAVADDPDREPLAPGDDGLGYCANCAAPIPTGKICAGAIYCCGGCRKLASATRCGASYRSRATAAAG